MNMSGNVSFANLRNFAVAHGIRKFTMYSGYSITNTVDY